MEYNLLIIDDDPVHRILVEQLLNRRAPMLTYCSFADASEAFHYILEHNDFEGLPDLVLLDLDMPSVSVLGFLELFETISQSLEKTVDVVLFISGTAATQEKKFSRYRCVKGLISKPLTENTLDEILSSAYVLPVKTSKY